MTANSMAELEQMILDKMNLAMATVNAKAEAATKEEVLSFYGQGHPKKYIRTGKLGRSPRINPVSEGGKQVSFDVWLDQNYQYAVPNPLFSPSDSASRFTAPEVMEAAETGSYGILGKPGFWQRTEQRIKSDLDSTFASAFR